MCQLIIATLHEAEELKVALVVAARRILSDADNLSEDTFAESLQRDLAKLTKNLPVRFRHIGMHEILAV